MGSLARHDERHVEPAARSAGQTVAGQRDLLQIVPVMQVCPDLSVKSVTIAGSVGRCSSTRSSDAPQVEGAVALDVHDLHLARDRTTRAFAPLLGARSVCLPSALAHGRHEADLSILVEVGSALFEGAPYPDLQSPFGHRVRLESQSHPSLGRDLQSHRGKAALQRKVGCLSSSTPPMEDHLWRIGGLWRYRAHGEDSPVAP